MACSTGKKKCGMTPANMYDREVTLSNLSLGSRDAMGGFDGANNPSVRTIWCKIKPIRGVERLSDERITEFVDTVFKCDYINVTDLVAATDRTEWKLTYNGVDFNIQNVIDVDEAHQEVEIYARRGAATL